MGSHPWLLAIAFLFNTQTHAANVLEASADAVKEPSLEYMQELESQFGKALVIERYDSKGVLMVRDHEPYASFKFISPTRREINGKALVLRGLTDCPIANIIEPTGKQVECVASAREFAESQYNLSDPLFGRVVLCKTYVLDESWNDPLPVSCSVLIGRRGGESMVSYDDDNMVGTRVAGVAKKDDGTPLRPDMMEAETLAASMFGDAARPEE
jgi:hypothetical protein